MSELPARGVKQGKPWHGIPRWECVRDDCPKDSLDEAHMQQVVDACDKCTLSVRDEAIAADLGIVLPPSAVADPPSEPVADPEPEPEPEPKAAAKKSTPKKSSTKSKGA